MRCRVATHRRCQERCGGVWAGSYSSVIILALKQPSTPRGRFRYFGSIERKRGGLAHTEHLLERAVGSERIHVGDATCRTACFFGMQVRAPHSRKP